jgi:NADPH2:quinone reductase
LVLHLNELSGKAYVISAFAEAVLCRRSTIDVTDLIWKRASIKSFSLFAQPPEMWRAAWKAICALLESGAVKPIVARTFTLEDAAEALRYQIESRPFGRVVLEI